MPFGRWIRPWRFRARLTLWNSVVVLMVSATALVAVREGLQLMLVKELAISLEDEVYEVALSLEGAGPSRERLFDRLEQAAAGHTRHGWFLQVFGEQSSELVWSSQNTPLSMRTEPLAPWRGVVTSEEATYRLAYRPLRLPRDHVYLLRLGTSLDFVQRDVANVTRTIAPVFLLLVLLAPSGGYFMAGRAIAPLQAIIAATRRLKPQCLEERLPIRGTGDELDQLSMETNQFLDEIADHLRRNRDFVANAAHELRSPLSAIMASVGVALSRERSAEQYQELLATIHEEAMQLSTLTNQLLLLAESDAGLLAQEREIVPLDRLVAASVEMFAGVAEEKGVHLRTRLSPGVCVSGNSLQLRQVVNNLLENAIKFTPANGRVDAEVGTDASGRRAILVVRDSGIGIPEADQPYVFDRFYQVDRPRHHADVMHGTGLGLSICRSIVEAYGGTISLESTPGRGSIFTVVIDRAPSDGNGQDRSVAATASPAPRGPETLAQAIPKLEGERRHGTGQRVSGACSRNMDGT